MRMKLYLLLLLATSVFGAALQQPTSLPANICWSVMPTAGLTERFPGAVSHAIHSITLEDLRYYFDKNASETNGVPIVNFDLKAKEAVLLNAPSNGNEPGFMTIGLKAVDQVLSHMDNPEYDIAHYSTLERLVHVLHMHEVWEMTADFYNKIKQNPPKSKMVCKCVKDIEHNGILKFLKYMSLKIRYPEIMYKKYITMSKDKPESYQAEIKSKGVKLQFDKGNKNMDGSESGKYKKNRTLEQKVKADGNGKYEWDGNLYKYDFGKDSSPEHDVKADGNGKYEWDGNLYKYDFAKDREPVSAKNVIAKPHKLEKKFPHSFYDKKHDGTGNVNGYAKGYFKQREPWEYKDNGVSHIVNEASWKVWRKNMLEMDNHDHYEAAMFLYCMLNE